MVLFIKFLMLVPGLKIKKKGEKKQKKRETIA